MMSPEATSVDEIITHYEELGLCATSTRDSSLESKQLDPEAEVTAEADSTTPPDNGHATGHQDQREGYMCHECIVEAWQETEYAGSPVYAMFDEAEPTTGNDGAQGPDRCASPSSIDQIFDKCFDKLLQPTAEAVEQSVKQQSTERHVEHPVDPPVEQPAEEPVEQPAEQLIEPLSSNDGSTAESQAKHAPSPLVLYQSTMSLINASDNPVSPSLCSPGNRSSTYTIPSAPAPAPVPAPASAASHPHLTHKSLMDNPFEQRINIKTLESYSQGLRKFWTTTALLLGPDYDYNYDTIIRRIGDDPAGLSTPLGERSGTSWPISPTMNVGKPQRNILGKELFPALESLGMAWRWFEYESALQKYINVRISMGESWEFGYCFERKDGSQHCMLMRVTVGVQHQKKIYEEVVDGPRIPEKLAGPGVTPRFWWCRQHPESKDHDVKRKARDKRLNERYAEAKKNLEKFILKNEAQYRFTVEESQKNLIQDLEVRENVEGRYSIPTLNTILKLAEIAESLGQLREAESWNRELVSRRVKRLGQTSEHTCYARFKLAQLLMKAEKWDEAKDVAAENLVAIADYDKSHALYCQQRIQASAIALKRRRIDAALEVTKYLRILEKNNPDDLKSRESALLVVIEAYTFQRRYDQVVEWLPKLIALYVNGFGTKEKKLQRQYELGLAFHKIKKPREAIKVFKNSISLAKELGMTPQKDEPLLDIFAMLGQTLFEEKEWNPAKFYLENAARGYRSLLGKDSEKYKKTKSLYLMLTAAMQIKVGLAERFAQHRQKQAAEQRAREMKDSAMAGMGRRQRVQKRLRDLLPGDMAKAW